MEWNEGVDVSHLASSRAHHTDSRQRGQSGAMPFGAGYGLGFLIAVVLNAVSAAVSQCHLNGNGAAMPTRVRH